MSKQETTSTQSLPVDDVEPSGSDVPSDPASASSAADPGASKTTSSTSKAAAEAAKKTGKILGMSKHVFAGLIAVVAVAGAVTAGVVLTQQPAFEDWYDSNASQGQFEGKSKEEIQAALNEEVAKGMMNISIAASINFPDGASEGEARIENIAANPMDQKVVITLKDTGETVYESAALAPDQHIQNITLTKDLDPGDYAAVATFTGYDRETHKQTGQAAAEIVIHVEG
ncbi:flagellar protein FliS [Eggerthella sinensis]|uniref:flagellar protein FliS n=1 Tax=Eggerthella sinensis TaxID=242230 RepID=UPI001D05CE3B|nr:flagellar protein FliS [Eggerthella sinensis]MCB7037347.1 flagellar protein FliS [Eggerthella sinensis]